ncbi:hypothetical protein SDC9_66112 [bioreactor metagenome]|uniref:Uncharacterized protein n=1 Tax=bioreactor metagenome TaxID=1076179 RepID=A0A644XTZ6_9ZZZZ
MHHQNRCAGDVAVRQPVDRQKNQVVRSEVRCFRRKQQPLEFLVAREEGVDDHRPYDRSLGISDGVELPPVSVFSTAHPFNLPVHGTCPRERGTLCSSRLLPIITANATPVALSSPVMKKIQSFWSIFDSAEKPHISQTIPCIIGCPQLHT